MISQVTISLLIVNTPSLDAKLNNFTFSLHELLDILAFKLLSKSSSLVRNESQDWQVLLVDSRPCRVFPLDPLALLPTVSVI